MITKEYGKDFHSSGGALTLQQSEVTDGNEESGEHTKTHKSGWTITGVIQEDYYVWINNFSATHPKYGKVEGNFEDTVTAETEEAFRHFWENHEPEAWDYYDI